MTYMGNNPAPVAAGDEEGPLTIRDAMQRLNISKQAVHYLIKQGRIERAEAPPGSKKNTHYITAASLNNETSRRDNPGQAGPEVLPAKKDLAPGTTGDEAAAFSTLHSNFTSGAAAAQELIEQGVPVFPVDLSNPDTNGKRAKTPKTPRGHNDATVDESTIARWWERWPEAVPGVPTGPVSGIWVLDIDPDGEAWAEEHTELLMAAGRINHTERGRHYLFTHADGIRNSAGKIAQGVDVRGDGGWIVWWPARGLETIGGVDDIAAAPEPLVGLAAGPQKRREPARDVQRPQCGESIIEGNRNATLARYAGQMRRNGMTEKPINAALQQLNIDQCSPPLDTDEVAGIAQSIARYDPAQAVAASEFPTTTTDDGHPIGQWQTAIDLFADRPVPEFPAEIMPDELRHYAEAMGRQTGFDPGAYMFVLLANAGCLMDHRTRIEVNNEWSEPPHHWGALVDVSGGGKTPVLNGGGQFANKVYAAILRESKREYAEWVEATQAAEKGDEPARPVWRQRQTDDATIEAMAPLLTDNPEGVTLAIDELTGWLGRMDAYTAGGGGKDRPAWLDAYGGRKDRAINRAKYSQPLVVPHWAAGVIGAIQPEVLAQQFRRGQGSSDGLLQRFMLYQMRPATSPNLLSPGDQLARINCEEIFKRLAGSDGQEPIRYELHTDGVMALQQYMTDLRTIQTRTSGNRFSEHLSKFPGFVLRIALTLHVLYAAAAGRTPERIVEPETMEAALTLARVLFRHSEAVYGLLDDTNGEPRRLAVSAAEAVLAKGWTTFSRSDLSRNATGWRKAERTDSESAVDLLIEGGWVHDITEEHKRGGRGRRSDGMFVVNPEVHTRFKSHGERITEGRKARHEAIQRAASERRGE